MFFSPNNDDLYARSYLPGAFEEALLQVNERDGFCDAVTFAANQAGCEFLFEVPAELFDHRGGRAAVIRSCSTPGENVDKCVLYIIFDGDDGVIRILEEFEVPGSVQAMTNSYSAVLEYMAGIKSASGSPLH